LIQLERVSRLARGPPMHQGRWPVNPGPPRRNLASGLRRRNTGWKGTAGRAQALERQPCSPADGAATYARLVHATIAPLSRTDDVVFRDGKVFQLYQPAGDDRRSNCRGMGQRQRQRPRQWVLPVQRRVHVRLRSVRTAVRVASLPQPVGGEGAGAFIFGRARNRALTLHAIQNICFSYDLRRTV
jgi:hypothetical protein